MIATINPPMPPQPARFPGHLRRGVTAVLLLVAAPKCVVCVVGWLGLGTALGLGGPEMCGASDAPDRRAAVLLFVATLALASAGALALRHHRKSRCRTPATASASGV
jgi:hypothetical protein